MTEQNNELKTFEVPQAEFEDYDGICLTCGEIRYGGVEPDARGYPCEACDTNTVVGLQNALLMGRVSVALDEFV